MRLPAWRRDGALRFSWCAASTEPDWGALVAAVAAVSRRANGWRHVSPPREQTRLLPPLAVHDASAARPALLARALLAARGVAGRLASRLHEVRDADARRHCRVRVHVAAGAEIAVGRRDRLDRRLEGGDERLLRRSGPLPRQGDLLRQDVTLAESDPYGKGWLYRLQGDPAPDTVDVHGYVAILDATIDKMLASRHEGAADPDEDDADER